MEKPAHNNLYKVKPLRANQQDRRQTLLREQKQQRIELQDEHRDIAVPMKWSNSQWRPRRFHEIFGRHLQLQLSEWLREKPDDLNYWILMPCPRGQRCFLVAYRQHTVMYNRRGRSCFSFQSLLPGNTGNHKNLTILDSIYDAGTDTFYILDVLSFGTQRFRYCETQMRFFWLKSKFAEEPYDELSATNNKKLCLLPRHDMDDMEAVQQVFQQCEHWQDNKLELDGYLFYHKEASYTCGTTPLVGWLFSFMVPDILGVAVNDDCKKPDDYTTPQAYMDAFEAKQRAKGPKGVPYPSEQQMRDMGHLDKWSQYQYLINLKYLTADHPSSNKALNKSIERHFPYIFEYDDDAAAGEDTEELNQSKTFEDNTMDDEVDLIYMDDDDSLIERLEEVMPQFGSKHKHNNQ